MTTTTAHILYCALQFLCMITLVVGCRMHMGIWAYHNYQTWWQYLCSSALLLSYRVNAVLYLSTFYTIFCHIESYTCPHSIPYSVILSPILVRILFHILLCKSRRAFTMLNWDCAVFFPCSVPPSATFSVPYPSGHCDDVSEFGEGLWPEDPGHAQGGE